MLGIAGLGDNTKSGASWLVILIMGEAIMPCLMGTVIDLRGDAIQAGFVVSPVYYVVLFFGLYGWLPGERAAGVEPKPHHKIRLLSKAMPTLGLLAAPACAQQAPDLAVLINFPPQGATFNC